jgi:hypothetical protein
MSESERVNDEKEAHQLLRRFKRSQILSVYFSLKDGGELSLAPDADASILYLIPIAFYESYFTTALPLDPLTSRIANLET